MKAYDANSLSISIHALREESDWRANVSLTRHLFQSTLSVRRATNADRDRFRADPISIHALREESD